MQSMPCSAQRRAPSISRVASTPARRQNLHEGDELSCRPAWRRAWISPPPARGPGRALWPAGSSTVTASFFWPRLERAGFRADELDVVGRGAAAAADDAARRPTAGGARTAPCIPASTDRCCGPPRAWAGRRWAWRSSAWTEYCIIRSMVSSVALGPTEQLRPMTSTGQESISRVKVSVSVPPGRWPKSSMVTWAMIGIVAAGGFVRGQHGLAQLVEVAEGFEDQQVDAGFEQRVDLLAEGRRGLRRRRWGRAVRCARRAGRRRRRRKAPSLRGFAGQAHAGLVDGPQLFGDAEGRQARRGWRRRCWFRESRRRP